MRKSYTISDIYQGGYSSLDPNKGYGNVFTGYRIPVSDVGAPTKPDTANQIQQVNQLLNQGIVPIEVGVLSPEVFDQIPKTHFKEINRMAKLTGTKISVHAPMIEPSGFSKEGWNESNRELAERELYGVIEKSVELSDKGQVPITIHSSGIPGTEWKMTKEGKKIQKLVVVNQESGKMAPLEEEEKYYPAVGGIEEGKRAYVPVGKKPTIFKPEDELESLNHTEWVNSLSQAIFHKEGADRILTENEPVIRHLQEDLNNQKINPHDLNPSQREALGHVKNAGVYLDQTRQYLNGLFHKAYKYASSEEEKQLLKDASKKFAEELNKNKTITGQSQALQHLMDSLDKVKPDLYVPIEQFAREQASQTFGNVAFKAYDKFKDKAPMMNIENMPAGMAFGSGEEMKNLLLESRKKFVDKAVEKGISRGEAEKQAERILGLTLDVGHLNIMKKDEFKDKDLIKELEQMSKYVKHVHITDNFGYSDSHLPPGMGNVPIKQILEELEKKGVKSSKIMEAGGWVQHFGTSPYGISLEAMGSPIYSMQMAPYWNQSTGLYQGYYGGFGMMLPSINYSTFGAGFSQLPSELGGQLPGQGGRMSGKQME